MYVHCCNVPDQRFLDTGGIYPKKEMIKYLEDHISKIADIISSV